MKGTRFSEEQIIDRGIVKRAGPGDPPKVVRRLQGVRALTASELAARTAWPAGQELADAVQCAPASGPKPDRFSTALGS